MDEYVYRPYSKPRARDFYDIYTIVTAEKIDLTSPENIELLKNIFAAKEVPLPLLKKVVETRDFHATDWPAVMQTVSGALEPFDFYFDFVVNIVKKLKSLGVI
jgi:Nucleotidyl transferase AbiEii toxin, Type IV TA system